MLTLLLISFALADDWVYPSYDAVGSHNPSDEYITRQTIKNLKVKWTHQTNFGAYNQVGVKGEYAYFGGYFGDFYAVNMTTNVTIWQTQLDSGTIGGVMISGNNLLLVSSGAIVYKFNRLNGTKIWSYPCGALDVWGSPILVGSTLVIPGGAGSGSGVTQEEYETTYSSNQGSIIGMDVDTGAILWTTKTLEHEASFINLTVNIPNEFQGINSTSVLKYGPSGGAVWSQLTYYAPYGWIYGCSGDGYTPMANGLIDPGVDNCFAIDLKGNYKWKRSVRSLGNFLNDYWNDALYYDGFRDLDALTIMIYDIGSGCNKETVVAFGDKAGIWYVWNALTGDPINGNGINTTALVPGARSTSYGGFNMGPAFTTVNGRVVTFSASTTVGDIGLCCCDLCLTQAYASGTLKSHLYAFSDDGQEILGHFSRNTTLFIGNIAITNGMLFMIDISAPSLLVFDVADISAPIEEFPLPGILQGTGSIGSSITIANGYVIFGAGIEGNYDINQYIAMSVL